MADTNDNTKIVKNTITLYIRTILVLLVSLYTSRVLLNSLGIDDYGIYNVVGSVVVLFSFINTAMTQATQRFITFELGVGNNDALSRVFSMALNTQGIMLVLILILSETIGLWFLNYKLVIPQNRLLAANVAYQLSVFTFSLSMLRVPYEASVIAHEKMSFFAYVSLIDCFLKLLIVFSLSYFAYDKLILYAVLLFFVTFVVNAFYVRYCVVKYNACKYRKIWDTVLFRKLFAFSGWSLCGSASDVFTQKGFIFLINIFIGVAANAAMGIANQVSGALRVFIYSFQTSFKPQITKSYAQGNLIRFHDLITETSKFSFALIILPVCFVIVNMQLLLRLWLGVVPEYAIEFCQIIAVCAVFDALSGSFYCAILSSENIKKYQLSISVVFLSDLIISYLFIKTGIQPYYVLYSRLLTRGILNLIIGLLFLKSKFNFHILKYISKVIIPSIVGVILLSVGLLVIINYSDSWHRLLYSGIYIIIIGIPVLGYIIMDKRERNFILSQIIRVISVWRKTSKTVL